MTRRSGVAAFLFSTTLVLTAGAAWLHLTADHTTVVEDTNRDEGCLASGCPPTAVRKITTTKPAR